MTTLIILKRWIIGFLIIAFIFSCSEKDDVQPGSGITITVAKTITVKLNSLIDIKPVIEPAGEYSFSWQLNGTEVSTESTYQFSGENIGETELTLVVTSTSLGEKSALINLAVIKNMPIQTIGYLPSWKSINFATDVKWDKLTHVCYSFITVNANGTINSTDVGPTIANLVDEAHKHGVAVLISVGGAINPSFSDCIIETASRQKTADDILNFVIQNNLDGADIDYEVWDGSASGASSLDLTRRSALENLYSELREKLPSDKLLTAAVNSSREPGGWYTNCFNSTMHQYLDFVNIMIYDESGTWANSPYGPHSSYVDHFIPSINHWLNNRHLPKEKLIAGVPFYGYEFNNTNGGIANAIAYKNILAKYPNEDAHLIDHVGLIYYDGTITMADKANYIKANSLGGIMIWELTQDSNESGKSLLDVIYSAL